jgi:hypothetical protein
MKTLFIYRKTTNYKRTCSYREYCESNNIEESDDDDAISKDIVDIEETRKYHENKLDRYTSDDDYSYYYDIYAICKKCNSLIDDADYGGEYNIENHVIYCDNCNAGEVLLCETPNFIISALVENKDSQCFKKISYEDANELYDGKLENIILNGLKNINVLNFIKNSEFYLASIVNTYAIAYHSCYDWCGDNECKYRTSTPCKKERDARCCSYHDQIKFKIDPITCYVNFEPTPFFSKIPEHINTRHDGIMLYYKSKCTECGKKTKGSISGD